MNTIVGGTVQSTDPGPPETAEVWDPVNLESVVFSNLSAAHFGKFVQAKDEGKTVDVEYESGPPRVVVSVVINP